MKLYEHQKQGLEAAKDLNHVAFYWDMGTGKTYAGSEKMNQLGADVNLVVCQKSKIQDWLEHFNLNYPKQFHVLNLTDEHLYTAFFEYQKLNSHSPVIGIINYDLIWRRPELLDLQDFTLLLDESSLIQNEAAKRSRFILKLNAKNVILLSGTPTGGKYEKLWSQMHLLGWNISKDLYWKQFVEVDYLDILGRSVPIVTGYKNVDRLKRKMAKYGCQFLKTEEVFDLPDQNFQKIKVQASKDYKKFRKDRIIRFPDPYTVENEYTLVGDTTLTQMLYERQLCGQYSKEKLKAFADLVESTEDRLVVFYNFTAELEAMKDVISRTVNRNLTYSVMNGSTKDLTAYEKWDDSITFIQYQAGAKGLNLQKANKIIYFTPTLMCEDWMQSLKRVHRIGQDRPCFYYLLLVEGSVEERIYKALQRGVNFTEELFRKDDEGDTN